jgi:arylsulfatase A-like enzyme
MLLEKTHELGIADDTYITYTSDHGTPGRTSNGVLSNSQGTIWEGGLRVPLLIA